MLTLGRTKLIPIKKKTERREARREVKAEAAARLEQTIEKELLARLKAGTYGELYQDMINVDQEAFNGALDELEEENEDEVTEFIEANSDEEEELSDFDGMELEEEDMEDFDEDQMVNFHGGDDDDSEMGSEDDEDLKPASKKPSGRRKRGGIEIEYEHERETNAVGK
jgi:protein MAK16